METKNQFNNLFIYVLFCLALAQYRRVRLRLCSMVCGVTKDRKEEDTECPIGNCYIAHTQHIWLLRTISMHIAHNTEMEWNGITRTNATTARGMHSADDPLCLLLLNEKAITIEILMLQQLIYYAPYSLPIAHCLAPSWCIFAIQTMN